MTSARSIEHRGRITLIAIGHEQLVESDKPTVYRSQWMSR